ncbi:5046_t:CDS:2 [Rhizophagus irregularis]|nr:5046_t:CDS:2 [Rhizophagus irregularis]
MEELWIGLARYGDSRSMKIIEGGIDQAASVYVDDTQWISKNKMEAQNVIDISVDIRPLQATYHRKSQSGEIKT